MSQLHQVMASHTLPQNGRKGGKTEKQCMQKWRVDVREWGEMPGSLYNNTLLPQWTYCHRKDINICPRVESPRRNCLMVPPPVNTKGLSLSMTVRGDEPGANLISLFLWVLVVSYGNTRTWTGVVQWVNHHLGCLHPTSEYLVWVQGSIVSQIPENAHVGR